MRKTGRILVGELRHVVDKGGIEVVLVHGGARWVGSEALDVMDVNGGG